MDQINMDETTSTSMSAAQTTNSINITCACNTTTTAAPEHKVGALTEFFGSDIVAALVVGLLPTFAMTIGSLVS